MSNSVAVTIPLMTAPPSLKLTPIPGTLKWLFKELPSVISLLTLCAVACAL